MRQINIFRWKIGIDRFVVLLGLVFAMGCTEGGKSILILQNTIPGDGCELSTSLAKFRSSGIIDVQSNTGYLFSPVIQNVAVEEQTPVHFRIAVIEGANVELSFEEGLLDAGQLANISQFVNFSVRFSGVIQPNGGNTTFQFEILPKPVLDAIAPRLVDAAARTRVRADVEVFGEMSNRTVKSNIYSYWIDVCNGCMTVDNGPCSELPTGFTPSPGGECNPLQDVFLDCCTRTGLPPLCPAAKEDEESN